MPNQYIAKSIRLRSILHLSIYLKNLSPTPTPLWASSSNPGISERVTTLWLYYVTPRFGFIVVNG